MKLIYPWENIKIKKIGNKEVINTLEKKYFVKVQLESDRSIKQKVEEVKFYIDNNFDKEIRLSDLTGKLFVSEQYLSKLNSQKIIT